MPISDDLKAINGLTLTDNYFYGAGFKYGNVYSGQVSPGSSGFQQASLSGTITVSDLTSGQFQLGGMNYYAVGSDASGKLLLFSSQIAPMPGQLSFVPYLLVLSSSGIAPTEDPLFYSSDNSFIAPIPACFASGALISTARGDVPVQELALGDQVLPCSGGALTVKWIGHRRLDCSTHPSPERVWPYRIRASALGPALPYADLFVSPGHAIAITCLDEVLIPVEQLANGCTIIQEPAKEIVYWHVELDRHEIIRANGLPTESYIDVGNRISFDSDSAVVALHPTFEAQSTADYCRPLVDGGHVVAGVRSRILAHAKQLGWSAHACRPDPRLIVDGLAIEPMLEEGAACFAVPERARELRLVSPTYVPQEIGDSQDDRRLGILILGISVEQRDGSIINIPLDHKALSSGYSYIEQSGARVQRWTTGNARLDPSAWAQPDGGFMLRIEYDPACGRLWSKQAESFSAGGRCRASDERRLSVELGSTDLA